MSKQPKYRQVADVLRREIDNGTYGPGSRLPSESEPPARFDPSRNTVRSGLSLLVSEGLISSSQGLGYEVRTHEVFELNASRFENLTFSADRRRALADVTNAGRRPYQTFRVELTTVFRLTLPRAWRSSRATRRSSASVIATLTMFLGPRRPPTIPIWLV